MTTANKFYKVLDEFGIDEAISEGVAWYPNAWQHCLDISKDYPVTPQRVAAIMAVTSPRARWNKNIEATYNIVADSFVPDHRRRASYGILNANALKGMIVANDRYYSRHVTGPKVSNFYLNIVGHTDPITTDSLMSKAAGYGSDVSTRIRSEVEQGVRTLADVFSLSPRDMQASIWVAYRGSAV
jgi:hypothetical protein